MISRAIAMSNHLLDHIRVRMPAGDRPVICTAGGEVLPYDVLVGLTARLASFVDGEVARWGGVARDGTIKVE